MDIKTATSYIDNPELPTPPAPRVYRTRKDPLAEVWDEATKLLSADHRLKAYALHEHLLEHAPDKYQATSRRTLERRVLRCRLDRGIEKDVKLTQIHEAADVLAFDFTDMSGLGVTIHGQAFPHMLFTACSRTRTGSMQRSVSPNRLKQWLVD